MSKSSHSNEHHSSNKSSTNRKQPKKGKSLDGSTINQIDKIV